MTATTAVIIAALMSGAAWAGDAAPAAADPLPVAAPAAPPATAPAQDGPPPIEPVGHLFGDWGGIHSALMDRGLDIEVGYTSEVAGNLSGGARRATTEAGQFSFDSLLDTDKAFGLKGGTFHSSISFRRGYNLTAKAGLGTLLQPQEIYGREQTWHLSEFWYEQKLGAVDIKLGRLPMGNDWAAQPCDFMGLTFCGDQQGNLVGDYWFNYPLAQWGTRVKVARRDWYAQVGIYEYNPNENARGIFINRGGATGVTAPAELGWTPHLGPKGLPGLYRVGGWYSTASARDVLSDANGQPYALTGLTAVNRNGRYGGYVLLQQQVTGSYVEAPDGPHATQGLTISLNFTQTDRRTARVDNQIALWLTYMAPFASRPYDTMGLAIGRNAVNSRAGLSQVLASPGSEKPGAEYPVEMFYTLHLAHWLKLSPDAQVYIHPGGSSRAASLLILGARTSINF